jgi:hypothetical protein
VLILGKPYFRRVLWQLISPSSTLTPIMSHEIWVHFQHPADIWKYLLGLELTDAGFDASVLSEFRTRLIEHHAEERLLEDRIIAVITFNVLLIYYPTCYIDCLLQDIQSSQEPHSDLREGILYAYIKYRELCPVFTKYIMEHARSLL